LWGSVNYGQSFHGLHNTKSLRTPALKHLLKAKKSTANGYVSATDWLMTLRLYQHAKQLWTTNFIQTLL